MIASSSALGTADSARILLSVIPAEAVIPAETGRKRGMGATGSAPGVPEASETTAGDAARPRTEAIHRTRRKGASPSSAALQAHS